MRLSFTVDNEDNDDGHDGEGARPESVNIKDTPITRIKSGPIKSKTKKRRNLFAVEPESDHDDHQVQQSEHANQKESEDDAMDLQWEAAQMKKVLGRSVVVDQYVNIETTKKLDINVLMSEMRQEVANLQIQLADLKESHKTYSGLHFDDRLLTQYKEHYDYLQTLMTRQPLDEAVMQEWREKYPSDFD